MNSNKLAKRTTNEQYYFVDILKFVCAILVIWIHTEPLKNLAPEVDFTVKVIARIAVPFFYCCTGFFVFKSFDKDSINFLVIKKYVIKYLRLYVIWSIIYFPLSLSNVINKDISVYKKFLILLKNFLFVSSYQHLWYLRAGFIALLAILILLAVKMSAKKMLILSGVLYFVGLFEYSYKIILKPIETKMPKFVEAINNIDDFFVTTRNGLFFAFFFICLGMFFAWYSVKLSFPKIGFVVFLTLMVFEAYFERKFDLVDRYDKFFFLPIVIAFMFYLALNVKINFNVIYVLLRRLSMWIYFIHVYVLKLFYYGILILFKNEPSCLSQFVATVLGSITVALIIYKLSKKNKFKLINYLC